MIFIATMLVDLDHLLSSPVFSAVRCSINYHPLHTFYAIGGYLLLCFFRNPFKFIGIGLLLHMLADLVDCMMIYKSCKEYIFDPYMKDLLKVLLC